MSANRRCLALMLASLAVFATAPGMAASIQIRNRSGVRMNVYMWCQAHNDWSRMAANQTVVSLPAGQDTSFDHHAGAYRIVAVPPRGQQFSQRVSINDGKPNRFSISPIVGGPLGQSVPSFGISEDLVEDFDDDQRGRDDALERTKMVAPSRGTFAENLGVYYDEVRYSNGTFGARLTAYPTPGSPAARLQLEPGDTIYELDGQRFRSAGDVRNHRFNTTMKFINVRTNASQFASLYIP